MPDNRSFSLTKFVNFYSLTTKMTQSRMTFRDLWRVSQCVNSQFSKNNVGGYLYVKFKCIYYNKLDSHLKTAPGWIRKIQYVNKGCECPAEIILSWNSSFKAYFIKKYCFLSLYCFFTMCFLLVLLLLPMYVFLISNFL